MVAFSKFETDNNIGHTGVCYMEVPLYFVGLADNVILFAQSEDSIQKVDYVSKEKSNQKPFLN